MQTRIKGLALMLAVILTFSGGIPGSIPIRPVTQTPTPPVTTVPPATTIPTTVPETTIPTDPTTEPATEPTTEPATEPTTEPTEAVTTLPPTTAAPTTLPPTTVAPTTVPPTTVAPTTLPPTTAAPTTVPPTTAAPTTVPPTTVPPTTEETQYTFTAHHAFVYDCTDGTYRYTFGGVNDHIYPASITKLLTALVALKYLDPATEITVGDILYTVPSDSSKAFLQMGNVLTVEQLLYGMLLPSGNDAARVLSAAAGRAIAGNAAMPEAEAMAVFVAEMNTQAADLGMTGSHFMNPDGWPDNQHYTTMADLVILAQQCLNHPLILQVIGTPEYLAVFSGRTLLWKNSNMLLNESTDYYLPDCIGLKTGYTKAAGRCLLSAFLVEGKVILAGVFGCPDPGYTIVPPFQNTMLLYEQYIRP